MEFGYDNVSVIVPCRNECDHVDGFISNLSRLVGFSDFEVLIADGRSDDGTRRIIEERSKDYPNISLVDNPGQIVSTGLNLAARAAANTLLVRLDVHTEYDER